MYTTLPVVCFMHRVKKDKNVLAEKLKIDFCTVTPIDVQGQAAGPPERAGSSPQGGTWPFLCCIGDPASTLSYF